MELYKEKKNQTKKWALKVDDCEGYILGSAVDAETGELQKGIFTIGPFGLHRFYYCPEDLKNKGYDPNQHGDIWDNEGRIKIVQ